MDEDATNLHNRAMIEVAKDKGTRTGMRTFVSQPTREIFGLLWCVLYVPASAWSS
jgi:hypothetical protein